MLTWVGATELALPASQPATHVSITFFGGVGWKIQRIKSTYGLKVARFMVLHSKSLIQLDQ